MQAFGTTCNILLDFLSITEFGENKFVIIKYVSELSGLKDLLQ